MNYTEAKSYMLSGNGEIKPGLERISELICCLGNPHNGMKIIHIAGTNGKGSVSAFVSAVLEEMGYVTGRFNSPWLSTINESICVNGVQISNEELISSTQEIKQCADNCSASEFEKLVALAFCHFRSKKCEFVVLEAGMGGELDATNFIKESVVSIITKISVDHKKFLGESIEEIARHKAGIIKRKGLVVTAPQVEAAKTVIQSVCEAEDARFFEVDIGKIVIEETNIEGTNFRFGEKFEIKMLGEHQVENCCLAILALEKVFGESEDLTSALKAGLKRAFWPGRFEVVKRNPWVIVDGAHNVGGVEVLLKGLRSYFPGKKLRFVIGILADKEAEEMTAMISEVADEIIVLKPKNERALDSKLLVKFLLSRFANTSEGGKMKNVVEQVNNYNSVDSVFVFCGSLYIVNEAKEEFQKIKEKQMLYESTRGGTRGVTSAQAITKGIATDGGLFVPAEIPVISKDDIFRMSAMSYYERALFVLNEFLTDFEGVELIDCINGAYSADKFDTQEIAPVKEINSMISVLELWHGPTSAFKDMALQILPRLLVKSVEKLGEKSEMVILVATSGDTGKAALEGFKDVSGTRIIVFFPENGVSQIQRMQMITQEGKNIAVFAIDGNFDDAQNGVKEIFSDKALEKTIGEKGFKLSSANSINWGRLVPQIVYYFSGYADMISQGTISAGESINIVVPTGNFGNILAAYFAKEMGLPINKLICASNENNVLADFINTGKYDRKRDFVRTVSPSMDILISSNLERLLYLINGRNSVEVSDMMRKLSMDGEYQVPDALMEKMQDIFFGDWCSEEETISQIKRIYDEFNYVIDTHTAVGFGVYSNYLEQTGDAQTKTLIVSTASPFKFNDSVCRALFGSDSIAGMDEFQMLDLLANKTGIDAPEGLKSLDEKVVLFEGVFDKQNMKDLVLDSLGK